MIEIKMTGMCKGCPCADLELDKMLFENFEGMSENVWTIQCIHEGSCERMKRISDDPHQ